MSERTTSSVECPVCSEEFDPTAAGGWCTNSECGQWRYEGVDVGTGDSSGSMTEPNGSEQPSGSATSGEVTGDVTDETDSTESGTSNGGAGDGEHADIDPKPAIRRIDTAAEGETETAGNDAEEEPAEDDTGEADEGSAGVFDCPGCDAELDADVSFCPSCGEDVSDYDPASENGEKEGLTECPSCGTDVGAGDSFCADCGENLDAIRESSDGTEGANATAETGAVSPQSLVLATRGEEIVVDDGDAVGRELRRLITDSGGDQEDAVRIHREHVRFVREDGQFLLEDLGQNPTRLNNIDMEQGDRKPVSPGDEIDLSGVVEIEVREP